MWDVSSPCVHSGTLDVTSLPKRMSGKLGMMLVSRPVCTLPRAPGMHTHTQNQDRLAYADPVLQQDTVTAVGCQDKGGYNVHIVKKNRLGRQQIQ